MDPFEEFQFKPLTDGLGFHKKPAALKDQVKSAGLAEEHLQNLPSTAPSSEAPISKKGMTFDDVIGSLEKAPAQFKSAMPDKSFLEVTEALPRTKPAEPKIKAMDVEMPRPIQSPFPAPEIFRKPTTPGPSAPTVQKTQVNTNIREKTATTNAGVRRGAADSPQGRLVATSASVPAAMLDLFVVTAFALIFLAVLLSVTKVDLNVVIRGAESEMLTRVSLVLLYLLIVQMYVVVSRAFYGQTLGEWTFDVQLGLKQDQGQTMYPIRVIWRSLITSITGFVLLPLLSLIVGQDLAGRLSGVKLYQQN